MYDGGNKMKQQMECESIKLLGVKPTEDEDLAKFLRADPDFVKQLSGLEFLIAVLKRINETN